jgi:hypothetical protein
LSDLERVHPYAAAVLAPVSAVRGADLAELAHLFDEKWARARKRLGGEKWWERLHPYHPLLCRIGLFRTLDLGLHETAHTGALAWLMDPGGDHGFEDILLRAFLKRIFGLDTEPQLSNVSIMSEIRAGENRDRLDVLMKGMWTVSGRKTEKWMVVVEAKIEATEGEDQCARYVDHLREDIESADRHRFVFLTQDGRAPVTQSKITSVKWMSLSFIQLMALIGRRLHKLTGRPGFEILRHYMTGVLKDLYQLNCGEPIRERDDIYSIGEYLSLEKTGGK